MDEKEPHVDIVINEELLAKKREIIKLKEEGEIKIHPFQNKFENLVRDFLQGIKKSDQYLQFYNLGHIFEAVFAEVESYQGGCLGSPLKDGEAAGLLDLLEKELGLGGDVGLGRNRLEEDGVDSVFVFAVREKGEIDGIRQSME